MTARPHISIIVPVYNGAGVIEDCIESLLALDYPPQQHEIIVVDNASSDETATILERYPVVRLDEPARGGPAARNTAIARARGEILAFTDADCIVEATWARAIETTFRDPRVDAVIGFADGINPTLNAAFTQRRWEESWFELTHSGHVLKHPGLDTRNCALRKERLVALGGFDADFAYCGDLELSTRLNSSGANIVFCPEMRVWHKNPATFGEVRDKSRRQLPHVLRMLQRSSAGQPLPFPRSAFFNLSGRNLGTIPRAAATLFLRGLRQLVLLATLACLKLGIDRPWSFKLYKLFFGISFEIAVLAEQRRGPG